MSQIFAIVHIDYCFTSQFAKCNIHTKYYVLSLYFITIYYLNIKKAINLLRTLQQTNGLISIGIVTKPEIRDFDRSIHVGRDKGQG